MLVKVSNQIMYESLEKDGKASSQIQGTLCFYLAPHFFLLLAHIIHALSKIRRGLSPLIYHNLISCPMDFF